jgi:hypothetical protein
MISSVLFRAATRAVVRRNITTTATKRSADPVIGHIDQAGQPGKVCLSKHTLIIT